MLKETYIQKKGPEIPPFDAYAERIEREFQSLLASEPKEGAVQGFLEQNPCMVPGAWTPKLRSGHGPIHGCVIRQPRLSGFMSRLPDFMWLSTHSCAWYPAMIEIEMPGKLLFTAQTVPRAEFTQARNQITEWRVWLSRDGNIQNFTREYGIPSDVSLMRKREFHFILVYGRRSEFENDPDKSMTRSQLFQGHEEELMSFDRLSPDRDLQDAITVDLIGNGRFRVVAVPETFSLSPFNADHLHKFIALEEAIDANPGISADRKSFLKSRIPYWKNWSAAAKGTRFIGRTFRE